MGGSPAVVLSTIRPSPAIVGVMTAFSFQTRASCCFHCGQPVSGQDGAQVHCTRCGQPVPLKPRATFVRNAGTPPPGQQPPHFRAQDGKPLLPPPNIAFLWDHGGEIPPHREPEALMAWQGARRRAAAMDIGAGEEVCMLTRAIAAKAEAARDYPRMRATIEAGLECVPLPRQRAILLGMMARAAVRAQDPQSAAAWLACIEPPQDLESDSEHRMTTGVVATARGDFNAVLNALGWAFDQIAIQDALDPQAVIFRVNALERMGRTQEAMQQLQQLVSQGPGLRNAVERLQQQYQGMSICAMTLPAVTAAHEQQARSTAGTGKIMMGYLLIGVSLLPVVITIIAGVAAFFSDGTLTGFIGVPFSFIFVFAFGIWGLKTLRTGQRERHVFANGVRAAARVIGASPTGVSVNDVPEMSIDLHVETNPPLRTAIRMMVQPGQMHILVPGTMLYVRVDPRQPDLAVLDQ